MSSNPVHGEVYSIQHYVIKFVSDLRLVVAFSGTPVSSTNKNNRHDITEILLKVALSTINHKPVLLWWVMLSINTFQFSTFRSTTPILHLIIE
jgi:hypothetical protein